MVNVAFDLEVADNVALPDQALLIEPYLKDINGNEIALPTLRFNGRSHAPYYRREVALNSNEDNLRMKPYEVRTLQSNKLEQVSYNYSLMTDNKIDQLVSYHYLIDCCDKTLLGTIDKDAVHKWEIPSINASNLSSFIMPQREAIKQRNEQIELRVGYPFDRDEVLEDFRDNAEELGRLHSALLPILQDGNTYSIKVGTITGYASPEGTKAYNKDLSLRRAKSIKNYLANKYPTIPSFKDYNTVGAGADWDGAIAAIEADDSVPDKNGILSIMRNVTSLSARQAKVKEHFGYNYVAQYLYPYLRRSVIDVKYDVRNFDNQEVVELLNTRPKDLSIYEIYQLRDQYKKEGKDEIELYRIAAQVNPTNQSAQLNYARELLLRGDHQKALNILLQYKDEPKCYNNIGVCYMLQGNRKKKLANISQKHFRDQIRLLLNATFIFLKNKNFATTDYSLHYSRLIIRPTNICHTPIDDYYVV